jgi:Ca2+:H+ antiporter
MLKFLRSESPLLVGIIVTIIAYWVGADWLNDLGHTPKFIALSVAVFGVMLWCAFAVVGHADELAELLGEPYGTLILTISVISIEVAAIGSIMLHGQANPTLARDTMLAVLMIVLNGMVGLCLLVGGWRHVQQEFNLQGARAYLAVLVTLATITLVMPKFTISTPDPSLTPLQGVVFAIITVMLYGTFLAIQTMRHRGFFIEPADAATADPPYGEDRDHGRDPVSREHGGRRSSVFYHAAFLVLTLLPIVLLSKKLAILVDHGIEELNAPAALGGVVVAILVLSPEGMAALIAARANHLQRAVNICLGSALSTIGLTVPAVLMIGLFANIHVVLGLEGTEIVLVALTLLLGVLTFGSGRTNILQGAVHLVVFVVYLLLIFDP